MGLREIERDIDVLERVVEGRVERPIEQDDLLLMLKSVVCPEKLSAKELSYVDRLFKMKRGTPFGAKKSLKEYLEEIKG